MFSTTTDKTLICSDCGQEFAFTASEQQFYADRQFSEPRRCPSCRASRKAARGDAGARQRLLGRLLGRRLRPRSPRDVQRDVRELRPRGAGPVPTERHQAGLLQRLLLEAAQLLDLDRSIDRSPADPAGLHRFRPAPWRSVMRPMRISRPTLARRQDLCIRAWSSSWRQPHVASRSWGASDAAIERHERARPDPPPRRRTTHRKRSSCPRAARHAAHVGSYGKRSTRS